MKRDFFILCCGLLISGSGHAGSAAALLYKESVAQESLISEAQRKLLPILRPALVPQAATPADDGLFIAETPCGAIGTVELAPSTPAFLNAVAQSARGHCIGANGLARLQRKLQNELIARGYITSRLSLAVDGRNAETLVVAVHYGRVGQLKLSAGSSPRFHPAFTFPLAPGDVLNLRQIEQGLENIGLIPDVVSDIRITPGSAPGESDIEIYRRQDKYWRMAAWMDDSGARSTGRYQAGGALYLDNPSALNDVFYASMAHSVFTSSRKGNESRALYYSLPFGFWSVNLFAGDSRYHQTINGNATAYRYQGRSAYWGGQAGYTLSRSSSQRTALSAQLLQRVYRYYLNDTEIELQRARLTNMKWGISHLRYRDSDQIALSADIITGSGGRAENMLKFGASILKPFSMAGGRLRYLGELSGQVAHAAPPIQDKSFIGDRSTVRGFRGDYKLIGSSGGYWRNTWLLDAGALQPYVGLDYGQLSRQGEDGGRLAGGVIGLQALRGALSADLFVGAPLEKPAQLPADRGIVGFSSQVRF